jgi:hypothetical protein
MFKSQTQCCTYSYPRTNEPETDGSPCCISPGNLHALAVNTGAEKFGGPVAIEASMKGTGQGSSGGILRFNPL